MRIHQLLLCCMLALFSCPLWAQIDDYAGIIPAPVTVKKTGTGFILDKTVVLVSNEPTNAHTVDLLNAFIVERGGFALREEKNLPSGKKAIILTSKGADKLPAEGYRLEVTPQQLKITGSEKGLFYALQSLMQLWPVKENDHFTIPGIEIVDYPRFSYRGMHLDVARHFFPISFIKKYIDKMAYYKMNNFHWHLTEDQGWRIEIKRYPKLTQVGGSRNGTIVGNYPGTGGTDDEVYKGFYTQEEAKEIVAYAAARHINVIPEIEMPGHASAAIAAYPELSCFPDRDTYIAPGAPWSGPRTGKQVQQTWGVFDDVFVPSENTFTFLENVLDEIMAIFPSKYIHIGGDECPKTYWKESAFCQQLIKEKGLKDEHELQSYFIQRIEKYINSKGRSIIGWDEILEGGLAPNATVMAWRGPKEGIEAASQRQDVIITLASNGLYFDHKQSNSKDEPLTIGGLSTYAQVYAKDPVPSDLHADLHSYIIGVQANMWSEYLETPAKVEYMLFPRMLALSEIAWTLPERKNLKQFSEIRLPVHLAKLDASGTNYWVPVPLGLPTDTLKGEKIRIELKSPVEGARIFYTLDGYRPSENASPYRHPMEVRVPQGKRKTLKTIVIAPSGRRSVVTETILSNE